MPKANPFLRTISLPSFEGDGSFLVSKFRAVPPILKLQPCTLCVDEIVPVEAEKPMYM